MSPEYLLLNRRRVATGESHQEALTALQCAMTKLFHAGWANVADHLALTHPVMRAPLDVVQEVALPRARHLAQAELEAGILEAVSNSINHLHNRPPFNLHRQARVIDSVSPRFDKLTLHVVPHALGPLVTELLPTTYDDPTMDEIYGLPGLRYDIGRRHVRLYLVDHPTTTRVDLLGITRTQWKAALAYRSASLTASGPIRIPGHR